MARKAKTASVTFPAKALTDVQAALERHGTRLAGEPLTESAGGSVVELEIGGEARRYLLPPDLPREVLETIKRLGVAKSPGVNEVIRIMTPHIAQSVDRAARSSEGWSFDGEAPQFVDAINRHTVEYVAEGQSREVMHRSVLALNPRVADVWRLVTAMALEAWQANQGEPPAVWVDVMDLIGAMGFEKHHKGGYRAEHVQAAVEAIGALCNLWVVVPMGARVYPEDPTTKRRKRRVLAAERRSAVLVKLEVDQLRDMFGGEVYPLRWHVRAGPWIRDYPRSFAPMLKALVELNTVGAVNVWSKAIGTELTYLQAGAVEDGFALSVRHLLERSGLFAEVQGWAAQRNSARARDYFERALDMLQRLRVFRSWSYDPEDFQHFERAARAAKFERWLGARVRFEHALETHRPALATPPSD